MSVINRKGWLKIKLMLSYLKFQNIEKKRLIKHCKLFTDINMKKNSRLIELEYYSNGCRIYVDLITGDKLSSI